MSWHEIILALQSAQIERTGWAVTHVLPDDNSDDAPFSYTVGLTARGRPELVIAGLDPLIADTLLHDASTPVHNMGIRFRHRQRVTGLLAGYDAVIVDGTATDLLHPGTALARYGPRVRLQQIVWPDRRGRYPWDPGYRYPAHVQPLLAGATNPPTHTPPPTSAGQA